MAEDSKIQIFQTEDGRTQAQVRFEQEIVWLTQRQMGELFATTPENILMHLKIIFRDAELDEAATTKDFLAVRTEGNGRSSAISSITTWMPLCPWATG